MGFFLPHVHGFLQSLFRCLGQPRTFLRCVYLKAAFDAVSEFKAKNGFKNGRRLRLSCYLRLSFMIPVLASELYYCPRSIGGH